ncbi:fructose PTS transporter subunit IIA [Streptomyces albiaxialis]|uniref:Fructose PTS transporter subunit IIA n=1 Tax=Streptomyces albiaxialis TaxID=329523 RepID=A0ABP5IJK5_9ACTN
MTDLISADLVDTDLPATDRRAAVRLLAGRLRDAGRVTDLDGFLADVEAREAQAATGLDGGVAIPHCRSAHVTAPSLAFGRVREGGIDFGAADGVPADLVFLIAAPEGGDSEHLKILAALARRLVRPAFTGELRAAQDAEAVAAFVRQEVTVP